MDFATWREFDAWLEALFANDISPLWEPPPPPTARRGLKRKQPG